MGWAGPGPNPSLLEGLAKSNWNLALPSKSSSVSQPFLDPLKDSVYSRILANNIDENSFDNDRYTLEKRLVVESNTAVYETANMIKSTNAYSDCKVNTHATMGTLYTVKEL